ncbi:MAG: mechanosensitive ion channel domain-containing protein [Saprospiraceae bacterium]
MVTEQELKDFLYDPMVVKITALVFGFMMIWLIIQTLQKNVFSKIKDNDHRYKTKKLSSFIGYLLSIVLITLIFSDKLGNLTVALGVAGAGIAFALQEVIASFAGWLAIMFGGFYKTGDRVQLGGIKGDVMDIGVLRTTIMETGQWVDGDLYNGRIVLIANSFVFKEPVFNYSGDFPFLWDEIKIPVQYGSDYELASKTFEKIGNEVAGNLSALSAEKWHTLQVKYMLEEAKTDAMVSIIANDNWVEFTLRYVVEYKKRRITKTQLFTQILKAVETSQGRIRFASATFHIVETPEINVRIKP